MGLAPPLPRVGLVLQYLQERPTPHLWGEISKAKVNPHLVHVREQILTPLERKKKETDQSVHQSVLISLISASIINLIFFFNQGEAHLCCLNGGGRERTDG